MSDESREATPELRMAPGLPSPSRTEETAELGQHVHGLA